MSVRSLAAVAAACVTSVLLAACGPTDNPPPGQPTTGTAPATTAVPTATAQAVKELTPGNCTVYPKAQAVALLGGVNMNNTALDIPTDGGTKIDLCSYMYLKGAADLQGFSYAVVRFDSATTAFAQAQKVQSEMLDSASQNNWPVESLVTAVPGSGKVLGGYGTKEDNGLPFTLAVVGTNVGPYLVAVVGGSTESPDNAKNFALAVFKAVAAAVG
jgi:hypothetical protein